MPDNPHRPLLYIATRNTGKLKEFRAIIPETLWNVKSIAHLASEVDMAETGHTFYENARIKAMAVHRATGEAVLADDSGLVVHALNGAPGVHSKRYAGPDGDDEQNNAKLLRELKGTPEDLRGAEFMCCLVFIDATGKETRYSASVKGKILHEPRGSKGFGYDPLFLVDGYEQSMAELTMEQKNAISHRANATKFWLKDQSKLK